MFPVLSERRAVASHLPHEDLSPADEHGGTGDVEPLLQSLQVELLHLLVTALHFHRMEGEHRQPLHVLRERRSRGKEMIRAECKQKSDF